MFASKENIEKYKKLVDESDYLRNSIEVMSQNQIDASNRIQTNLIDNLSSYNATIIGEENCKHVLISLEKTTKEAMIKLWQNSGYEFEDAFKCPNCSRIYFKIKKADYVISYNNCCNLIIHPEECKDIPEDFKEHHPIVNGSGYVNADNERILYLRALADDEDRPPEEVASRLQGYIDEAEEKIKDILDNANLQIENIVYGISGPRKKVNSN